MGPRRAAAAAAGGALCLAAIAAFAAQPPTQQQQHQQLPERQMVPPSPPGGGAKGLVAFVALGRNGTAPVVRYNAEVHFSGWACVVFAYATEEALPLSGEDAPPDHCSVVRLPGLLFGQFLKTLAPAVVAPFTHVAVVLDDCLLGRFSIDALLAVMRRFKLAVASPVVHGAGQSLMRPSRPRKKSATPTAPAARLVHFIEVHATVFRRDAWACFWRMLWHGNAHGYGYDMCYHPVCSAEDPGLGRMAVLEGQEGFHLEHARPDQTLTGLPQLQAIPKAALAADSERSATARKWIAKRVGRSDCKVDRTIYARLRL